MMIQTPILTAALGLAAQRIPCFACRSDKAPATPHGFKDATTDATALRAMFKPSHCALIGVPMGEASGLDALDLDPRHGADAWWEANQHRLPMTRTHRTRSGGLHLLFQHKPGLRNSAGKIGPGVDVRAEAGYIVWWPGAGLPVLCDADPAPWPDWIIRALMPPPAPLRPVAVILGGADASRRYAGAALRRAVERVATAPEGARNNALNNEALALARFVPDHLSAQEIADALMVSALMAGLTPSEIEKTLASALRAGGVI